MTTQVQHIPRTVDADPGHLPGPSDTDAWTAELVFDIAEVPPCTRDELIATYGTADPDVLRGSFALPDDVAAAERYAAEDRQVAA